MKKIISSLLVFNFIMAPVFASQLDMSIDEDIRKHYNPSKIEHDMALPPLPKILNEHPSQSSKTYQSKTLNNQYIKGATINTVRTPSSLVLKKGTKIYVKSLSDLSSGTTKGTQVAFVSVSALPTPAFTIPSGTTIYGVVENSHKPQFMGNGGLLTIKINSIILNNSSNFIDANITKVNSKKVFCNDIKGKRRFMSSMARSMQPGYGFFVKMSRLAGSLATDGSSILLSPVSLILGCLGIGANVMVSPLVAAFRKGDNLYLKKGSQFEIKLQEDARVSP